MESNETRITRITRALGTVTSIFRCHGLQRVSTRADAVGAHDLLYWIAFLALISAWFLFVYMPQLRRYEKLVGREQSHLLQLSADKRELARLHRGIASLKGGDALAWERAARKRLGWLEPGEVLDIERWRSAHASANTWNGSQQPNRAPSSPVLPRPRVPQIPRPPQSAQMLATQNRASVHFADSGALGPTVALPPAPPPLPIVPALPPRSSAPVAQRVSVPARQTSRTNFPVRSGSTAN